MLRKLRWPLLIVLLALVAIGFLLTSQQPILKPVEPVVEPATGGVYAEGLIGSMLRLNPLLDYYNNVDRDVDHLLFSGLVRFDDRGYPVGDLADSWGISQDGTVYNFSIRQNAPVRKRGGDLHHGRHHCNNLTMGSTGAWSRSSLQHTPPPLQAQPPAQPVSRWAAG